MLFLQLFNAFLAYLSYFPPFNQINTLNANINAQVLVPTMMNFLPEKRSSGSAFSLHLGLIKSNPRVFFLGISMALGSLGLAFVNMFADDLVRVCFSSAPLRVCVFFFSPFVLLANAPFSLSIFSLVFCFHVLLYQLTIQPSNHPINQGVLIYALSTSAVLCVLAFYCLPRTSAKCNLYLFLGQTLYIQIPGALDFFYTADEQCLPGG
jgi:hypothetical protein